MSRLKPVALLAFAALTFGLVAAAGPERADAQPKGQPKGRPPAPAPKFNAYKVQVRHPGWRRFLVTKNHSEAKNAAATLRRADWTTVQVNKQKSGAYVVRAKIAQWRNRAVLTNPHTAAVLANQGRAQGFQARVVPFHR